MINSECELKIRGISSFGCPRLLVAAMITIRCRHDHYHDHDVMLHVSIGSQRELDSMAFVN